MLEIGWHLRQTNAPCVEVLVQRRHREECYEVLHLEPYWRLEEVQGADIPAEAALFVYRRAPRG